MRRLAFALLATALLIAACGDDDADDEASADGDLTTYCEKTIALETLDDPDVDFESASEEEIAAAVKEFAADTLKPLAAEIQEAAPSEVADDVDLLVGEVDELAESGDFEAAFGTKEVNDASDRIHEFDLENCDIAKVEVTAVDYAFEGMGDTDAGVTSFEVSNEGEEPHELVLFKRNEGTDESIEELLALEEDEVEQKVTFVTATFAEPGDSDYAIAELDAGDYAAICFIPVGGGEEGPPHFTEGMFAEFTVD